MADDKAPEKKSGTDNGKLAQSLKKHKGILIAGLALAVILAYFLYHGQSSSAAAPATAQDLTPDNSGLSSADLGSLLSGTVGQMGPAGPTGETGATGATGAKGATGKAGTPSDPWQLAKESLEAKGIKNPSSSQIWHERGRIFGIWGNGANKKKSGPVKKKSAASTVIPASHSTPKPARSTAKAPAGKHA